MYFADVPIYSSRTRNGAAPAALAWQVTMHGGGGQYAAILRVHVYVIGVSCVESLNI